MQENHQIIGILTFKWVSQKMQEIHQINGTRKFKWVLQKNAKNPLDN